MTPTFQNTFSLLSLFPFFHDAHLAADALRCLIINAENQNSFLFAVLQRRSFSASPSEASSVIGLDDISEFQIRSLSLAQVVSFLTLLLPHVDYSFLINLFRQLQRQSSTKLSLSKTLML